MKNYYLILFFTLSISTFGQTSVYHSFPDSNVTWNFKCYDSGSAGGGNSAYAKYSYLMTGDTTISGISYHKISCPDTSCVSGCCWQGLGYLGAFREDIPNKKVYYRLPNDTSETILYDFNLNKGDTGHTAKLTYYVYRMDSVFVGPDYRKKWKIYVMGMGGASSSGAIIEGIGAESSLFDLYNHTSGSGHTRQDILTCYVYNNSMLYQPDTTESCQVITSIPLAENANEQIILFPNPCHSAITLQFENSFEMSIFTIYNLLGETVLQQRLFSNNALIDLGKLEKGMYYYHVAIDNRMTTNGMIVVE